MSQSVRFDFGTCVEHGVREQIAGLEEQLLAARSEVFADVELLDSKADVPADKQPLDAGFIEFPKRLLEEYSASGAESLVGRIETAADRFRSQLDRVVVLGIGGSYMGARALFEALCHPYHNELSREARQGTPRIAFEGNNVDNDSISGLLDLLSSGGDGDPAGRWGIVVISKSGGTLETAASFRIFRDALEQFYGADSAAAREFVIPVTGEQGRLRSLSQSAGYETTFPIPDGIGGRFSVLTAVGLLPAAILGIDVPQLLAGAADMTEQFRTNPLGSNPVLDYTANCHVMETRHGMDIRLLSTWGARLEALGLWYDQLLSESLGKKEQGATPITVVNTRDLHSRGQQHQEGKRDKLITNVYVEKSASNPIAIASSSRDEDQLNQLAGRTVPEILDAAYRGTNEAYAEDRRPTANLIVPELNAYTMGQMLQMLMLATTLEGRLIGINPYGQPGVEGYKQAMTRILFGK